MDIPELTELGDDLFDNDLKVDRAREFFTDPRHHMVVGLLDGKIVGMASAFHYVHPDKDTTMFINEASVLEELQGQGIGREIIRGLVKYSSSIGCTEAWLATETSNIGARKAYSAAGGVEDAEQAVVFTFENSGLDI